MQCLLGGYQPQAGSGFNLWAGRLLLFRQTSCLGNPPGLGVGGGPWGLAASLLAILASTDPSLSPGLRPGTLLHPLVHHQEPREKEPRPLGHPSLGAPVYIYNYVYV